MDLMSAAFRRAAFTRNANQVRSRAAGDIVYGSEKPCIDRPIGLGAAEKSRSGEDAIIGDLPTSQGDELNSKGCAASKAQRDQGDEEGWIGLPMVWRQRENIATVLRGDNRDDRGSKKRLRK